jgi:hypothetical protein
MGVGHRERQQWASVTVGGNYHASCMISCKAAAVMYGAMIVMHGVTLRVPCKAAAVMHGKTLCKAAAIMHDGKTLLCKTGAAAKTPCMARDSVA